MLPRKKGGAVCQNARLVGKLNRQEDVLLKNACCFNSFGRLFSKQDISESDVARWAFGLRKSDFVILALRDEFLSDPQLGDVFPVRDLLWRYPFVVTNKRIFFASQLSEHVKEQRLGSLTITLTPPAIISGLLINKLTARFHSGPFSRA